MFFPGRATWIVNGLLGITSVEKLDVINMPLLISHRVTFGRDVYMWWYCSASVMLMWHNLFDIAMNLLTIFSMLQEEDHSKLQANCIVSSKFKVIIFLLTLIIVSISSFYLWIC